jgi:hypothetical protein
LVPISCRIRGKASGYSRCRTSIRLSRTSQRWFQTAGEVRALTSARRSTVWLLGVGHLERNPAKWQPVRRKIAR